MKVGEELVSLELVKCLKCKSLWQCECQERERNFIAHITPRAHAVARGECRMTDERPFGKQMKAPALLVSIFGVETLELPQEVNRITHHLAEYQTRCDFSVNFGGYEKLNHFYLLATLVDQDDESRFLERDGSEWKVPVFGGPLFNLQHPHCVGRGFQETFFQK